MYLPEFESIYIEISFLYLKEKLFKFLINIIVLQLIMLLNNSYLKFQNKIR
jgi:hypothetical protein